MSSEYRLVWEDDFDSETLDRSRWNVEIHEPGWVNNELQEYIDSDRVLKLSDGMLEIIPVKDGDAYYSGRISTEKKCSFMYGKFEIKAKVPSGRGFLPAFWLMSENEEAYGFWPGCGEIDCMEVLGSKTDTCYGTIHFGMPYGMKQGVFTSDRDLSEDFHIYSCEWTPEKIEWSVDGRIYHSEPAGDHFDHEFYMILNLAIGGNWPGDPDASTVFEGNPFLIDHVRVYRKE